MESVSRPAGPSLDLSLDVVQECLLGGALGDALGYPIEFTSSAEIRRRFGAAPPERLEYAGGGLAQISDDTQMTLFVAEGVIRGVQRAEDRGSCFMPSVVTRGHPSGYLSAAYFASVVWDVARGSALSHAMLQADDQLAGETGGGELIDILARARKLAERGPPRRREDRVARRRLDRRAGPRHRAAMRTHLRPRAPRRLQDDTWRSAAHGGDSDSTAALPADWLAVLELRDVIERIATDLHRRTILDEMLDREDYPTI
jgi:hypothetical protein